MSEEAADNPLQDGGSGGIIEPRANPNRDPKTGRFASGKGGAKSRGTKYAPSPQRNKGGIQLKSKKKFAQLCGTLNTKNPGLKEGDKRTIRDSEYQYDVTADGFGGVTIERKYSITRRRNK